MKKIKNYLFVLMSLFVLPLLLTSCSNETVESTENLTKLSNTQATAAATSWKSISNAPSGGWENVSGGITIPAGSYLRMHGASIDCLIGAGCDDMGTLLSWISEDYGYCFEDFKNDCTPGSGTYDYVYTYSVDKIKYEFTFFTNGPHQCGCSWFDDKEVFLQSINIYFDDVQVYDSLCQNVCMEREEYCQGGSYAQGVVLESDATIKLTEDLYINTSDYYNYLEYFVFHTMWDAFEYSIPGTVPAGAKIKMTNPTVFNGHEYDDLLKFQTMLNREFDSFLRFMDTSHTQQYEEGLGIDLSLVNVDENEETVYLQVPIYTPEDSNSAITFEIAITSGDGNNSIYKCCPIWSDGGYFKAFKMKIGNNVVASLDTSTAGCPQGCDYYEVDYNSSEFTLPEEYTLGSNNTQTTIPEYCKYIFENSYSYMIDLQAPSLTGTNSFTVNVDSLLSQEEILSHVIATDDTDEEPEIIVESSTYTAAKLIGTFYINVHAVDEAGNVSPTYILTINVKDSTDPRMSSVEKRVGNNELLTEAQLLALFTATDNYYSSSDLTIEIISDGYTSKYKVPGKYEVIAMASDPSGNTINKSTYVTVFDATIPTISASSITTGNNKKLTEAELKALFTYSDDVTGTSNLKFEFASDNYSSNYNKLGSYQVTGKVTDEAGNYASATSTITVEDRTVPNISGSNKNAVYTTLLSQAELKALFTISDDVTATEDIAITIIEDDYTANYNKLGSYNVKAEVVDENGNKNTATSTVKVLDNIKPIITGADINITNATILTEEQIRNYYKVNDAYDGELQFTLTWVKNYLETPSKVGVYSFTISASDSSNNPISQTFNLNVTDGIVPELWLDNYFIVVDTNTEVTQELLVAYAAASLCVAEADIVSVDGSFDNSSAGIYILSAKLADGTEKPIKLSIVEGEELPTDEDTKYQFNIKDIFKGEFWANYASGWTNNFAWPHWTTIGLAVLMLGALVIAIRKRK